MLTSNTRLKLQDSAAHHQEVSLGDRIAHRNSPTVMPMASWLRTARRVQRGPAATGVDQLLTRSTWVMWMTTPSPQNPKTISAIGSAAPRTGYVAAE